VPLQAASVRTAYYDENVYSAARPPPDTLREGSGPACLADLRPGWAQKKAFAEPGNDLESALEKVKSVFVSRGAIGTGRAMWRVIRQFDYDNSGAIDMFELGQGMENFGIKMSKQELLAVMAEFDKDGNRRINLEEFMVCIRGNLSKPRMKAVETAFGEMDSDKSGECSMHEVSACYDPRTHPEVMAGKLTREEAHQQFIDAMDKDHSGTITKQEFVTFFKDISLAMASDEDFVKFVRGMWRRKR